MEPKQKEPFRIVRELAGHADYSHCKPAGIRIRLAALFIDAALVSILDQSIRLVFERGILAQQSSLADGFTVLWGVTLISTCLYWVLPVYLWGHTAGKRLLGLRVIRFDHEPKLTLSQCVLRELVGKFLSGLCLGAGHLMALGNKERRTSYDRLSGTCVIKEEEHD